MKSNEFTTNAIEAAIRVGLLLMLAMWCLDIVRPFVVPVVWGLIIAVAIYPLFINGIGLDYVVSIYGSGNS